MKKMKLACSSMAALLLSGTLVAQQNPNVPAGTQSPNTRQPQQGQAQPGQAQPGTPGRNQPPAQGQPRPGQQAGPMQGHDVIIAQLLALDNMEEVAIAQFVQKRSKSDEVKKFAKMMEEEHSEFLQKLQQVAPHAVQGSLAQVETGRDQDPNRRKNAQDRDGDEPNQDRSNPRTPGAGNQANNPPNNAQPGNNPNQQPAVRDGANNPNSQTPFSTASTTTNITKGGTMMGDALQMHQEIAQQCLADTKKMLQEKQGNELDMCYVGQQVVKHGAMKSKLTVFERHASPELKNLIAQGRETTENHLQEAERLIESLGKDAHSSDSSSSQRRNSKQE